MPIIRHGYATAKGRTSSTRAHRRARAQTLAEEHVCFACGEPPNDGDPLVAGHIVAHAYGGPTHRSNYHAMHASCNNKLGAFPLT